MIVKLDTAALDADKCIEKAIRRALGSLSRADNAKVMVAIARALEAREHAEVRAEAAARLAAKVSYIGDRNAQWLRDTRPAFEERVAQQRAEQAKRGQP